MGVCDVLVCGGGPAGVCAAVAAARNGARTVLLERYGFLGGMASAGMVNPIYGFFARHMQVVSGIPQELIDRLAGIPGGTAGHCYRHDCIARRAACGECITGRDEGGCPVASVAGVCPVDGEAVKLAALELVDDAGVDWRLHTYAADVQVDGAAVREVIVCGKSGFGAYRADVVVDATGDADVVAQAGAPFHKGGEDGETKPPSLMFRIGNVRLRKDRIRVVWPEGDAGGGDCWLMALPRPGEYTVNSPSGLVGFDGTDTADLSRAQAGTTRQVFRTLDLLRKHVPGCEAAELLSVAPQLGLRDSRRIAGAYTLTEADVLESRKFPEDGIACGVHPIDLHTGSARFGGRSLVLTRCGDYYEIPYRCLIPNGVENVLVAGRPVSATFAAQGSVRVMATCMAMGQAAGTAAGLCVRWGCQPREVDAGELRRVLAGQGAYVGEG